MRRMSNEGGDLRVTLTTDNANDDLSGATAVECRMTRGRVVVQDWTAWTIDGTPTTSQVVAKFTPTDPLPVGQLKMVWRIPIGGGLYKHFPNDDHTDLEVIDLP